MVQDWSNDAEMFVPWIQISAFWCVFYFLSGQSVPEGAESEANGGFHVQRSEETRIWRGFPLALSVYRLIHIQIYHAACAYKHMFHTKLPATERYDRLYL